MTAVPETATPAAAALTAAANAAAAVLPSPAPLLLGPTDGSLVPGPEGSAVIAAFTGAVSGSLAVIVDPSLAAALAAVEGGGLPLAEAVAPALEAASAAIGPAVLGTAQVVPAQGLVAAGDTAWAPLVGDGEVLRPALGGRREPAHAPRRRRRDPRRRRRRPAVGAQRVAGRAGVGAAAGERQRRLGGEGERSPGRGWGPLTPL